MRHCLVGLSVALSYFYICRTYDWGHLLEVGDYNLLEYIDGMCLKEFMQPSAFNRPMVHKRLRQLCEVLRYIASKQLKVDDITCMYAHISTPWAW